MGYNNPNKLMKKKKDVVKITTQATVGSETTVSKNNKKKIGRLNE